MAMNQAGYYDEVKSWYGGYHFGNASVYCPWDVINHVDKLGTDSTSQPEDYWVNSGESEMVSKLIEKAVRQTRDEIELLIAGEPVDKEIRQELAYREITELFVSQISDKKYDAHLKLEFLRKKYFWYMGNK